MSAIDIITIIENGDSDKAYEEVLPEAMALPNSQLTAIRLDIPAAIITTVGVMPKLKVVYEHAAKLPEFEAEVFDRLPKYVLALASAHSRYLSATTPPEQIRELLDTATEKRDVFLADARALATRGLINSDVLKEFSGMHGYKNVAFDLMGVIQLLKTTWPNIEGRTALTYDELVEANKLALRLVSAIGHREQSPEQVAASADVRQRMFTLFVDAYEQARRAVIFLRWNNGDADDIAPSLYSGRANAAANRKPNADQPPVVTPAPPAATVEAGNTAAPNAAKIPIGMPGSSPLMPA